MIGELEIYDSSTGHDIFVGTLFSMLRRGSLSTTFVYDPSFLSDASSYAIDPQLPLSISPIHFSGLPGALRDSLPDRWGRHLIERELRLSYVGEGAIRKLDDIDYLVGVFDSVREGSLRVKIQGGSFLSESDAIPPSLDLPNLMDVARAASRDSAGLRQIKELLDAGSASLGGARPKASVREDRRLLLAKFSHPGDDWDVMGWEKTVLDLGEKAGIPVPRSQLVRIGGQSALLLERFDRDKSLLEGRRIPYISGMTLLASEDGEMRDYAELAEAITDLSDTPTEQLEQLFRRVMFYVAINNTDDHMRNWGFLRRGAWSLSPMFDVNPNPDIDVCRATSIIGAVKGDVVENLRELAAYCSLDDAAVRRAAGDVISSVSDWEKVARANGVRDTEIRAFEGAFTSGLDVLSGFQ